jgi:hypothetical protein
MILIASLLAPTVPSLPMPQNMHWYVPGGSVLISGPMGRDVNVTSSGVVGVCVCVGGGAFEGVWCGTHVVSDAAVRTHACSMVVMHAHAHVHVNMTHMRAPVMPTVKRSRGKACVFPAARFGIPAARLSNTALAMAGVKSLLPRP